MVEQVETGHMDRRAIKRSSEIEIFVMHALGVGGVNEGFMTYHVTAHIVCPFEDLGTHVHKELIRGPPPKDHDLAHGVVI